MLNPRTFGANIDREHHDTPLSDAEIVALLRRKIEDEARLAWSELHWARSHDLVQARLDWARTLRLMLRLRRIARGIRP